jgi:pimeloyl-ACP methyl ester carboxylesterase
MKSLGLSTLGLCFALASGSCISLDAFFFNPTAIPAGSDYTLANYPAGYPEALKIPADRIERLTLTDASGAPVFAAFARHPTSEGRPTVLYHHGNASNIDGYWPRAATLFSLGANLLVYDYPGYGRTPGSPTEEGIYRAARAAHAYLRSAQSQVTPGLIFHYGYSLGGAPATQMAWESTSAGLLLEAPFTSVSGLASDSSLVVPSSFLMSNRFDNRSKIRLAAQRAARGVLIVHGTVDDFVQTRYGRDLFDTICRDSVANRATLALIDGADHGTAACSNRDTNPCLPAAEGSLYLEQVRAFLQSAPVASNAQRVCTELPAPATPR